MGTTDSVTRVDARGPVCPMPTIRLGQAIRRVDIGEAVEMWADDGVEFAGAPTFLDFAGEYDVQLFI